MKHPLEHLLFDLESEQKNLRLSAVMRLSRSTPIDAVVHEALQKRLEQEEDEEVSFFLRQKFPGVTEKAKPSRPAHPSTPPTPDQVAKMLADSRTPLSESIGPWQELDVHGRTLAFEEFFQQIPAGPRMNRVLDHGDLIPWKGLSEKVLEGLLSVPEPGVTLKTLHLLERHAPERAVFHLPGLLLHPSIPVRFLALRALDRIWPTEAMRLLQELLQDADPNLIHLGMAFLFQFPFEDVAMPLLQFIESHLFSLREFDSLPLLLQSNPHRGFLSRLCMIRELKPEAELLLQPLLLASCEALSLSGIEPGNPNEILRRFREQAGKDLGKVLQGETPPSTPDPVIPADLPLKQSLENALKADTLTPEGELAVREVINRGERQEPVILAALALRQKWELFDEPARIWMLRLLDHPRESVLLLLLRILEKIAPRQLLAHLPVLCFHNSPAVASQAVRILRRQEGTGFLRRLQSWAGDSDPRARRAALAGFLQMEYEKARPLVLALFRTTTAPEGLEELGKFFEVNPDFRTIRELEALIPKSPIPKQDALRRIISACQESLATVSGTSRDNPADIVRQLLDEMNLPGRIQDFIDQIRNTHYSNHSGGPLRLGDLGHKAIILLGLFLALGSMVWFRPVTTGVSPELKNIAPAKITRSEAIPPLPEGTAILATLREYDTLTRYWKIQAPDSSVHKVRFPFGNPSLQPGRKIALSLDFQSVSPLGYNLYQVQRYQILNP